MINRIKTILGFKKYSFAAVVVFRMKSGAVIKVPCDNFDFTISGGTSLSKYTFTGAMNGAALFISLPEIESVSQQPFNRFKSYL